MHGLSGENPTRVMRFIDAIQVISSAPPNSVRMLSSLLSARDAVGRTMAGGVAGLTSRAAHLRHRYAKVFASSVFLIHFDMCVGQFNPFLQVVAAAKRWWCWCVRRAQWGSPRLRSRLTDWQPNTGAFSQRRIILMNMGCSHQPCSRRLCCSRLSLSC